jgi:hypothetical protein
MLKKPAQQGRSERRGEGVRFGTLNPLSDAKTTLASFFSILLVLDLCFGDIAYHH